MRQRFPLRAVLLVREISERQKELQLAAANRNVREVKSQLQDFDRRILSLRSEVENQTADGTTGAALRLAELLRENLTQLREFSLEALTRSEEAHAHALSSFLEARRNREVIECLQRSFQFARTQQSRRDEQRRSDELHLVRLGRR